MKAIPGLLIENSVPETSVVLAALKNEGGSTETNFTGEIKRPRPRFSFGQGSDEQIMVGPVGLEPTTNGLKVRCSTN
jgi:hypothetical protein